ncbi:MAG: EamA family transporter [Chitinophagaceae bacterium]|nr:EamA family transporter [Chitinophagaceae bacterium]
MTRNQWAILFAFAAIYIIWGSTYLIILYAIKTIPPLLMSAIRFMTAGLILYAYAAWKGEKQPDFISFIKNTLCGILLLFGGTVAVAWAEQYLPSSITAVIVTSVPFWFVILDKKQWSWYFSNKLIIAGLLTGSAGVVFLLSNKSAGPATVHSSQYIAGIIVLIAGGIAWTAGSLFSKYYPARNSLLMNASIQLMTGGFCSLMVSLFTGESEKFSFAQVTTASWLALLYLTIIGSLVAYLCYLWLLKIRSAAQVSTYVYVNPVVAVLLGAIIAREKISGIQVVSLLIILGGVLLVNLPKYKILQTRKSAAGIRIQKDLRKTG